MALSMVSRSCIVPRTNNSPNRSLKKTLFGGNKFTPRVEKKLRAEALTLTMSLVRVTKFNPPPPLCAPPPPCPPPPCPPPPCPPETPPGEALTTASSPTVVLLLPLPLLPPPPPLLLPPPPPPPPLPLPLLLLLLTKTSDPTLSKPCTKVFGSILNVRE